MAAGTVKWFGLKSLTEGAKVSCEAHRSAKGPAANVQVL